MSLPSTGRPALQTWEHSVLDKSYPTDTAQWEQQRLDEGLLRQRTKSAFPQLINLVQQTFELFCEEDVPLRIFGANETIRQILFRRVPRRLRRPPQHKGATENDRETYSLRNEDGQARGEIGE